MAKKKKKKKSNVVLNIIIALVFLAGAGVFLILRSVICGTSIEMPSWSVSTRKR